MTHPFPIAVSCKINKVQVMILAIALTHFLVPNDILLTQQLGSADHRIVNSIDIRIDMIRNDIKFIAENQRSIDYLHSRIKQKPSQSEYYKKKIELHRSNQIKYAKHILYEVAEIADELSLLIKIKLLGK